MAPVVWNDQNTLVVIAPSPFLPRAAPPRDLTTPYGTIHAYHDGSWWWLAPAPPYARIYAAKELGAERVIELLPLRAVNRLLQPGDLFIPDDLLDMTWGQCETFFVDKGYGFVPQNPPFCSILRVCILAAARSAIAGIPLSGRPRVFGRGTCGAVNDGVSETEQHVLRTLSLGSVDAFGHGGAPSVFLARELELCYAILGYVADAGTQHERLPDTTQQIVISTLEQVRESIPHKRLCQCPDLMRPARERGLIGDDWHTWLKGDSP